MKKIYQITLLIGLATCATVLGFFLCKQSIQEKSLYKDPIQFTKDLQFNNQPLNGEETTKLVSKLFNELGPRIGSHLVEPNAVLTLAGLRGSGNFLMHDLTNDEKEKIKNLNNKIELLGIIFLVHEDIEDEIADISIVNLKGLEYASTMSRLPFVEPFDAKSGLQGRQRWIEAVMNGAKEYFNQKNELSEEALQHLIVGLLLGYPDQALLDAYYVHYSALNHQENLVYSKISYSDYYENPQPNFAYLPEHENDESITRVKKSWGKLLEDFYASSWAKVLAQDATFIQTMKSEQKAHNEWFARKR